MGAIGFDNQKYLTTQPEDHELPAGIRARGEGKLKGRMDGGGREGNRVAMR